MGLSRRMLFGRGAAAAAAASLAPAAIAAHGLPAAGILPFISNETCGPAGASIGPRGPTAFFSFAKWWAECGDEQARRQSRFVRAIDPDILGFALPLQTKMRMQQERDYQRVREERERDFVRSIARDGKFEWWT